MYDADPGNPLRVVDIVIRSRGGSVDLLSIRLMILNRSNEECIAGQTQFILQKKSVVRCILGVLGCDIPRGIACSDAAGSTICLTHIGKISQRQNIVDPKQPGGIR